MLALKILHVFSVGTSLLRNFAEHGGRAKLARVVRRWAWLSPDDEEQLMVERRARRGCRVFEALVNYLDADPREASAELNAFYGLTPKPRPGEDGVVLYSTDTGTGWLCARALGVHLEEAGFRVEGPHRLRGFGLGPDRFEEGLMSVVDLVVPRIKRTKARGLRVYVNPTGGFKPEAAFLVLASALAGADRAYYVHEAFREVVELPLLPIKLVEELVEPVVKLGGEVPLHEAGKLLQLHGAALHVLKDRGLVEEAEGFLKLKAWVRELLKPVSELA